MAQPNQSSKPATGTHPAIVLALLVSAVMLIALGTILPSMMELEGPEGLILSVALYAAAAGDVAIALWFRSKLKNERAASGGTVRRQ